jgi:retron-type reverse transcriptase
MKRVGNLWYKIIDFENLLTASKKAQKGKRFHEDVLRFNYDLEGELFDIRDELMEKTYQPGEYKTFEISEPKKRMISAAPYRDRVVHHALCNVIEPIFEKSFIYDSYANRKGKGTHKALDRFVKYFRSSQYVLKCDIVKYFPSIDHEILKNLLRQKIKCKDTLWLINLIIDNSNPQILANEYFAGDSLFTPFERKKGLPIGNLTSQFFANIYLNQLDHFIKDELGIKKYVRYVDDFAIFSHDKLFLKKLRQKIEMKLEKYRLRIHPVKSRITRVKYGENFLGFRIFPNKIRVKSDNLRRARRRMKDLQDDYKNGLKGMDEIGQSIQSWVSHLNYGDTYRLRKDIFRNLVFSQ